MTNRGRVGPLAAVLAAGLLGPAMAQDAPAEAPATPADATETPEAPAPAMAEPAEAAETPADAPGPVRWQFSHLDVIRLNPLGLETQNKLLYRRKLQESDSILFADTFGGAGIGLKLNPAFLKVGPVFEVQPIAVLHIKVAYEFMQFFGTFDYVQSYAEPTDPDGYSDDNRSDNADAAYVTNGHHIYIEPTLQAKAGSVAVRSKFAFEWWQMDLEGDDTVWYDATLDTYVPGEGFVITNDTDVLYLGGDLLAGLRLSWVNPIYSDDHFVDGAMPEDFDGMSHLRVGPIALYTLSEEKGAVPIQHRVLANVSWYLSHPNREGAMPYILVGYAYNRDL